MRTHPKRRPRVVLGVYFHSQRCSDHAPFKRGLAKGAWEEANQPPFLERLPGFFLERVATPRSRLTFCPRPGVAKVVPGRGLGAGVLTRSASVMILLPILISLKSSQYFSRA